MEQEILKTIMDELLTIKSKMVTKEDLQEVKDELKVVKDDINGIKDELKVVKDDINGIKDELKVVKEDLHAVKLATVELSENVNYIMDNMATKDDLRFIEHKMQQNEKDIFKLKELVATE